jgi:ADP-L-glycero-D-manno-heptose 6-epimerase
VIIVTGGAGFIGSNLVRALNARGRADVWVVDRHPDAPRAPGLAGLRVARYLEPAAFAALAGRADRSLEGLEALIHLGASTDTTATDEREMLANNVAYAQTVLRFASARGVPFLYASSAAVYGRGRGFREDPACEAPLSAYGRSKRLFDMHVRDVLPRARSQIVGLRYFNVYGPGEAHKGPMASLAYQLDRQLRETGTLRLFQDTDGRGHGEQRRDFVHVDDVVAVTLWFLDHPGAAGIFNVGTGASRSFNQLARAVIESHGRGRIEYVPVPATVASQYQSFTEADLTALRGTGYRAPFQPIERMVPEYVRQLGDGPAGRPDRGADRG